MGPDPICREQIKEHLKQFRESQGGLSNMRFNAIVAGVLALMKNSVPSELPGRASRVCTPHNKWSGNGQSVVEPPSKLRCGLKALEPLDWIHLASSL